MPCNAAVAITKAALENEQLMALVDANLTTVLEMVANYIKKRHANLAKEISTNPATGEVTVGRCLVTVQPQGQIQVDGPNRSASALAETLSRQVTPFVTLIADQLFAREVQRILQTSATILKVRTADTKEGDRVQRATEFTIRIGSLDARIFVLPGGRLQIFVDTGTFAQAKEATLQLLQTVQAQGFGIKMTSEVEQHRSDGVPHVHVQQYHRQKGPQRQ